jgi:hypothetical protein
MQRGSPSHVARQLGSHDEEPPVVAEVELVGVPAVHRPSLICWQMVPSTCWLKSVVTSAQEAAPPRGQSWPLHEHSTSSAVPLMRKPQPGKVQASTVRPGQLEIPRHSVAPVSGSTPQSMPVGVATEEVPVLAAVEVALDPPVPEPDALVSSTQPVATSRQKKNPREGLMTARLPDLSPAGQICGKRIR